MATFLLKRVGAATPANTPPGTPPTIGRWPRSLRPALWRPVYTPFGSQPIHMQTADTNAAEFGIACEACHGPSGEHARLNRSPQRRYWFHLTGKPDATIVQPGRLSASRSSQVCGQCHAFWEFYD